MFDFWNNLSDSDKIAVVALVVSAFLGIVSMMISVCTLKQSSKMIENSTRPYITVYGNKVYLGVAKYVLIIKNFGASSGKITKFSCDTKLKDYALLKDYNPFEHIAGTTLAPKQSIHCELDLKKLKGNETITFEFEVDYEGIKKYPSNKFIVNVDAEIENTIAHQHAPQNDISGQPYPEMQILSKEIAIMNDAINGIGEQMMLK